MNFRNFEAEEKLFARRAAIAFALVCICFPLPGVNLFRLQVRDHGYYYQTRSNQNDIRMIPIAPTRGLIYDRNGIPLVRNVSWYAITLTPYKDSDYKRLNAAGIAENYAADHNIGKQGIEGYYEALLHGKPGYQEVAVDNQGRIVRVLKEAAAGRG